MGKYDEKISDKSVWITATPTSAMKALPFFITEAGHFYAEDGYLVERKKHDSFLFLYTLSGCGEVMCGVDITLPENHAVMFDCRNAHSYKSSGAQWEFIWFHINGIAAEPFFKLLYSDGVFAVNADEAELFGRLCEEIIYKISDTCIINSTAVSADVHEIMNIMIRSSLEGEKRGIKDRYFDFIQNAAKLIRLRYSEQLSVEDIMVGMPISKYHFIRIFKRIMGVSPYNYLMNYRINAAKILLRTTDITVNETALKCGFYDTSNFIMQFKKHTGQKPLEYRQYFMQK